MFLSQLRKLVFLESLNSKLQLSTSTLEKWDLASSVCLERKPIITKDLNDIEHKYSEMLKKVEIEMSFKSDHEIRLVKDKMYAEQLKKSDASIDIDKANLQTGQEFEDASEEELKKFKFADRKTPEDAKKDVTSTNRKLDNSLLLLIKQNLGNSENWVLPLGLRQEGESMRQAAERVLKEKCGTDLQTKFLGNAPCGFYKYKYPKAASINQSVGMKIFFFKAQFISGSISKELCSDFQWLSQKELDPVLQEEYLRNIKMFLVEDEDVDSTST